MASGRRTPAGHRRSRWRATSPPSCSARIGRPTPWSTSCMPSPRACRGPSSTTRPPVGSSIEGVETTIYGDLDLHGFLGLDGEVRPGFEQIRVLDQGYRRLRRKPAPRARRPYPLLARPRHRDQSGPRRHRRRPGLRNPIPTVNETSVRSTGWHRAMKSRFVARTPDGRPGTGRLPLPRRLSRAPSTGRLPAAGVLRLRDPSGWRAAPAPRRAGPSTWAVAESAGCPP